MEWAHKKGSGPESERMACFEVDEAFSDFLGLTHS